MPFGDIFGKSVESVFDGFSTVSDLILQDLDIYQFVLTICYVSKTILLGVWCQHEANKNYLRDKGYNSHSCSR